MLEPRKLCKMMEALRGEVGSTKRWKKRLHNSGEGGSSQIS